MSRLKIALPDKFVFSSKIPVRIGDINRGGHLGHESFFVLMEEVRERLLRGLGYPEANVRGVGLIMTDAGIVYLGQGRYGQVLEIKIGINDMSSRGFDMVYQVTDSDTGLELARAKTGHIFYDYRKQKPASVPDDFSKRISNLNA